MRYLKYINESFNKSDYYSEVERYEFLDKVGDSNSDSKERSILYKRLCNDFSSDRCEIEDNQILYGRFGLSKLCIGMDFEVSGGIFEFGIYLLSDEWYMVSVSEIIYPDILECKFYKCDQIDGLMELIRDKEEDIYSKYSSVEKLDESFDKSDYYIDITDRRYQEWMRVEPCDVSDGVRSRLIDLGLMCVVRDSPSLLTSSGYCSYDMIYILSDYYSTLQSSSVNVSTICEIRDEYFIVDLCFVEGGKRSYKCDQLDGLVQLLLDKGVINNNINESFSKGDYYQKISEVEYDRLVWGVGGFWGPVDQLYEDIFENKEIFTREEVEYLNGINHGRSSHIWTNEGYSTYEFDDSFKCEIDYLGLTIVITKLKDEYFIVNYLNNIHELYKCDQLGGLRELLKDKGVIGATYKIIYGRI